MWYVWQTKGGTLFPAGPLSEILTIANLRHATRRIWTCAEPVFRLWWMKLCSSDNHYTMVPQRHGACWLWCNNFLLGWHYTLYLMTFKCQSNAVVFAGFLAVAGMVLWNRLCPSFHPTVCSFHPAVYCLICWVPAQILWKILFLRYRSKHSQTFRLQDF